MLKSLYIAATSVMAVIFSAGCTHADSISQRVAKADDCFERGEYVCSTHNYGQAIEALGSLDVTSDEQSDYVDNLYIAQAESILLMVKEFDTASIGVDNIEFLEIAERLLSEADYRNSFLYLYVSLELINQVGVCDARTASILSDVEPRLSPRVILADANDYPPETRTLFQSVFVKKLAKHNECAQGTDHPGDP